MPSAIGASYSRGVSFSTCIPFGRKICCSRCPSPMPPASVVCAHVVTCPLSMTLACSGECRSMDVLIGITAAILYNNIRECNSVVNSLSAVHYRIAFYFTFTLSFSFIIAISSSFLCTPVVLFFPPLHCAVSCHFPPMLSNLSTPQALWLPLFLLTFPFLQQRKVRTHVTSSYDANH